MSEISKLLDDFFSSYVPSLTTSIRENRLERMNLLLERLGNPEKSFKALHTAGSKGKGTVSTALAVMIMESGTKTGLFLSPHVYDIRERFTLSSVFFTDEEYLFTLEKLKALISDFSYPISLGVEKPTTFELYTAYGYLLFHDTGCKAAVIETGLGGRLDATNTLMPIASVITNIELEHTEILGDTLEKIAEEKAGIIKKKSPAFIINQTEEVLNVFRRRAQEAGSSLFVFTPPVRDDIGEHRFYTLSFMDCSLKINTFKEDIRLTDTLYALFVLMNLGLIKKGSSFDFTSSSVNLPGRMEEREINGRRIILDGAHTPSSIRHLEKALSGHLYDTLVFSSAHDKNWKEMARIIVPLFKRVIVTDTGKWKKSYPERIYDDIITMFPHKEVYLIKDKTEVVKKMEESACSVVTGSFYLLCEIDRVLREGSSGD